MFTGILNLKASLLNLQLLRKHGMNLKGRFPLYRVDKIIFDKR